MRHVSVDDHTSVRLFRHAAWAILYDAPIIIDLGICAEADHTAIATIGVRVCEHRCKWLSVNSIYQARLSFLESASA